MKDQIGIYISLSALVLLLAYIVYNEKTKIQPLVVVPDEDSFIVPESQIIPYELPTTMEFAGEHVPLEIPDVRERLDREVQINTYWHNHSITLLKRSSRWLPIIEQVLRENEIPDDFKYLSVIESDLSNAVSPAKAVGFWQFLRGTGREFGLKINSEVDERYHPLKSTEAACRYLRKSYKKFGSWSMVAAAYNRGRAGMAREIKSQKETSYYDLRLNQETSRYVFRILAARELLTRPEHYGFHLNEKDFLPPWNFREIVVTESIPDLVQFAKSQGVSYKVLKDYNPWLRSRKLTVRTGEEYTLWISLDHN